MKQRKDVSIKNPQRSERPVQEMVNQINHIIDKDPKKAVLIIESWLKNGLKVDKKAS